MNTERNGLINKKKTCDGLSRPIITLIFPVFCPNDGRKLTSFESFEHFGAPMTDIQEMFSISKNLIFTTNLLPKIIPKPDEWWYYGLEHGQHISFYSEKTLKYLASKFNLHLISKGNLHILSEKKLNSFFSYLIFGKRVGKLRKMLLKFISHKCNSSLYGKTQDDMNLLNL